MLDVGDDEEQLEEEQLEEDEAEKLLSEKKHWRHMVWDPDHKRFIYEEDTVDAAVQDMPASVDDWKKTHPRDLKSVRVRFDGARESMIAVMKSEYDAVEGRLDDLGIDKTSSGLHEHLFGENSRFAQAMTRSLNLSQDQLRQFLATFYCAAEWGQPAKRLQMNKRFIYNGFMDQEALNEIWKRIGVAGKDGSGNKLWEEIQEALNKDCRELFLTETEGE